VQERASTANRIDYTAIEIPVILRDRIAAHRVHARQAYYDVIEDAFEIWEELGGWGRGPPAVDIPPPLRRRP